MALFECRRYVAEQRIEIRELSTLHHYHSVKLCAMPPARQPYVPPHRARREDTPDSGPAPRSLDEVAGSPYWKVHRQYHSEIQHRRCVCCCGAWTLVGVTCLLLQTPTYFPVLTGGASVRCEWIVGHFSVPIPAGQQ